MPFFPKARDAARLASAIFLLLAAPAAFPQASQPAPPGNFSLPHRSGQLDAAPLRAELHSVAAEAAFYGYRLNRSGWTQDEILCPAIPGYRIVQYRRPSARGSSIFSALVPRGPGRVAVVPILYDGATPFRSAVGSQRSIDVFNRVVDASLAQRALQSNGNWLALGACYAAVDGADPVVLEENAADPALVRAPNPLLRISEGHQTRTVIFTGRNATGRDFPGRNFTDFHAAAEYRVWTIVFDARGHVVSATAQALSDYVAHASNPASPKEKPVPLATVPKTIPLPAPPAPKAIPAPQ